MAVILNKKICDNAKECGGIASCTTGALYWDTASNSIAINNDLCISCFACQDGCPVGALSVATSDSEYELIVNKVENDPRTIEDLFVDRYGAMPFDDDLLIKAEEIYATVERTTGVVIVELFSEDSIQCLAHSIPVNTILSWIGLCPRYYKAEVSSSDLLRFDISETPALLFFSNGKIIGKITGVYNIDPDRNDFSKEEELKTQILEIVG